MFCGDRILYTSRHDVFPDSRLKTAYSPAISRPFPLIVGFIWKNWYFKTLFSVKKRFLLQIPDKLFVVRSIAWYRWKPIDYTFLLEQEFFHCDHLSGSYEPIYRMWSQLQEAATGKINFLFQI